MWLLKTLSIFIMDRRKAMSKAREAVLFWQRLQRVTVHQVAHKYGINAQDMWNEMEAMKAEVSTQWD